MAKYRYLSYGNMLNFMERKKVLYAVAYDIDSRASCAKVMCPPTKGVFVSTKFGVTMFAPLGEDEEVMTVGQFIWSSRCYADTYEEAVELYNELVQDAINKLEQKLDSVKQNFIGEPVPLEEQTDVKGEKLYTHDFAAAITEIFENVLSEYKIRIPSPEDDERESDNTASLYGSTYAQILD